ncbi:MAG: SpoIIE family protein phosphatase [Candidatus Hinthialibacter antarcticus]|nr:SpoIIE family protein phosphatase [Candidatus Hinthialibacter antarcticus]
MNPISFSINVLLISPQDEVVQQIKPIFGEYGFSVLSVSSKKAALRVLYSNYISLVVVDGTQDQQTALRICQNIQLSQLFSERPLLLIHNEDQPTNLQEWLDAGVTDFITAPICSDALSFRLRVIKNHILKHSHHKKMLNQISDRGIYSPNDFFSEFVKKIAKTFNVKYGIISKRTDSFAWRTKTLSFWSVDQWGKNFEYDLDGSPCETVFQDGPQWYGTDIQEQFPKDKALKKHNILFYLGVPLQNRHGEVIGHACILHDQPVAYDPYLVSVMNVFAVQAANEMEFRSERADSARLKAITENLDVGLLLEDEARRIQVINANFCELAQIKQAPNELVGLTASEFAGGIEAQVVDRERFQVRTNELCQLKEPVLNEEWILKDERIINRDYFPVFENETYKGCLWLFRDVTYEKSKEFQLNDIQEQEIEIGSKIQKTLLLGITPTDIPALDVAALSIPSKRIDGDFYDFFHVDETRLDVLVGDVMGKGVPAALLGAAVKSHFQRAMRKLLAARPGGWPEPREIVARVHHAMTEQLIELESFFTLFYMRFDVKQSECVFLDCGHMPTIWFQAKSQTSRFIQGENLPIGVSESEQFGQRAFSFEPGDFFVMYSDGLTEAPSPSGELFGIERLKAFVDQNHTLSPNELIDKIHKHLAAYTQSPHFSDDLTCVVVKICEYGVATPSRRLQDHFEGSLVELERGRQFLKTFYDESQIKPDQNFMQQLTLAMNEAAANIIQHAYDGEEDGQWEMIIEEFQDRWVLSLLHNGTPFDPDEAPEPDFDGSRSSGFGVYIIRNSVDEAVYGRHDDGRCLIQLMKRF